MRGVFAALLRASELIDLDREMRPLWREFLENLTPIPTTKDTDALRPADYSGPNVFARGRKPAVKAAAGILPDQNSMPHWFFDLCNQGSEDVELWVLANQTFDAFFPNGADDRTPVGVLSKLPIAATTLGRADAVRFLIPNQIRALRPERSTAYRNGGVLMNRMTLREGPQALDAERLGRAAEALHLALLQSAPAKPAADSVIRLFPACPKHWKASFQLLSRGNFLVNSSFEDGAVLQVRIQSLAGAECRISNPWGTNPVVIERSPGAPVRLSGQTLAFATSRGEQITLRREGAPSSGS